MELWAGSFSLPFKESCFHIRELSFNSVFIFPVELPQAGPLLCRGNLFTLEESKCVEALLPSLMSCGPFPFWVFSSAFNGGPRFHCVYCLSLSLCLLFSPPSFPPFPTLGEIYPLYLLAAAALGHSSGAQSQVGPLPLFCLPCFALCSF